MSRRRTRKTNRLGFERLERRECPAVDVIQRGNTLFIAGDVEDDWVAVCDEGNQVIEVQTATRTDQFHGIKRVIANLGDGSDIFEFHQAETGPNGNLIVGVDLGTGDDQFLYRTPPRSGDPPPAGNRAGMYSFDIRTGFGNDVMAIAPEYLPGLTLAIRADLGDGHDDFHFLQGVVPMESWNLAVDLGGGDDRFLLAEPPGGDNPPDPEFQARHTLSVLAGFGNDVMTIQPCVVPGLDFSVRADLGDGDDRFSASMTNPSNDKMDRVQLDAFGGMGNDIFDVAIGNPDVLEPLRLADVHVGIHGSAGDDSGIIIIRNVAVNGRLTEVIDLGGGDDSVVSTFSNVNIGGLFKQSVNGGSDNDTFGFIIDGGRIGAVSQKVNVGDGDDTVSVSWKRCEILGPAVTQVALAEDHDVADITFSENKYFAALTTSLDAGSGDDIAAVMKSNPNEFLGSVKVRMALGDGDDEGTYFCDGHSHFAGSMALMMSTGGGDDSASVMIEDSEAFTAFEGPVVMRVMLGGGDDLGNVVVRDANEVAGPLTVAVAGGTGDDEVVADVDFTPRVRAGQLDPGNTPISALIDLRGGAGMDTLDAYTEGVWSGLARFILRGGDDDDDLGFHGVIGAGSTGALAVAVGGGSGDDVMASDFVFGPEPHLCPILFHMLGATGDDLLFLDFLGGPDTTPEPHLYVLDGGPGFDRARAATGVVVRNCESRI